MVKIVNGRKKYGPLDLVAPVVYHALNECYHMSYNGTDKLKGLDKGVVLFPNHQSGMDIIVEGVLVNRFLGRDGYYLMKKSLPRWLEIIGGIPTTRGEGGVSAVRNAYSRTQEALREGNVVVTHIQKTRSVGEFDVSSAGSQLRKFLRIQGELGVEVPFVPLEIEYEGFSLGSEISVNVRDPIVTENLVDLEAHLRSEVGVFV
ncbi:MAG: hypothetical protein KKF56_04580 [Nanoarchaeota archaeon]|nr:hypothetical protein [Nanoarchaeota archaeon]